MVREVADGGVDVVFVGGAKLSMLRGTAGVRDEVFWERNDDEERKQQLFGGWGGGHKPGLYGR